MSTHADSPRALNPLSSVMLQIVTVELGSTIKYFERLRLDALLLTFSYGRAAMAAASSFFTSRSPKIKNPRGLPEGYATSKVKTICSIEISISNHSYSRIVVAEKMWLIAHPFVFIKYILWSLLDFKDFRPTLGGTHQGARFPRLRSLISSGR